MMLRPHNLKVEHVRERVTDDVWTPVLVQKKLQKKIVENERTLGHSVVTVLTLVFMSLAVFSFGARGTISYFSDIDYSLANILYAGLLDFEVAPDVFEGVVSSGPGLEMLVDPVVTGAGGSFNLKYTVEAEKIEGDTPFCNAIHAFSSSGSLPYDGKLLDLLVGPTTSVGVWEILLSLKSPVPNAVVDGMTCTVDLVYFGRIDGLDSVEGYTDEERVRLILTAHIDDEEEQLRLRTFTAPLTDSSEVPPEQGEEGKTAETTETTASDEVVTEDSLVNESKVEEIPSETPPVEETSGEDSGSNTKTIEVLNEEMVVVEETVIESTGDNSTLPVLPDPEPEQAPESVPDVPVEAPPSQ